LDDDLFEFLAEDLAGPFEEEYVGFAIGQEFRLEIEDVLGILLGVQSFEFGTSLGGHARWTCP